MLKIEGKEGDKVTATLRKPSRAESSAPSSQQGKGGSAWPCKGVGTASVTVTGERGAGWQGLKDIGSLRSRRLGGPSTPPGRAKLSLGVGAQLPPSPARSSHLPVLPSLLPKRLGRSDHERPWGRSGARWHPRRPCPCLSCL